MENTDDGFIIADEDLKLRGPGEFFGSRQSGFLNIELDMVKDGKLTKKSKRRCFSISRKRL